jgi:hypothetical protein
MLSSLILDVAIGLVFVYFILSLLCSVIVEAVASLGKWRAKMLLQGISELIFAHQEPSSWRKNLVNQFKKSTPQGTPEEQKIKAANENFLKAFYRSPLFLGQTPSYISSRSFVLALLETVKNHPKEPETPTQLPLNSVENIKKLVEALPPECSIRNALLPLLEIAGVKLDEALKSMEKWYDEAMDRVTGWYKRNSLVIAMVVAFLVAFAVNADTFQIAKTLYSDQTVRAAVVNSAQELVKKTPAPAPPTSQPNTATPTTPPGATIPPPETGTTTTPPAMTAPQPGGGETKTSSEPQKKENPTSVEEKNEISPSTDLQAQVKQIEQAFKLTIPLGWSEGTVWSCEKGGLGDPVKWLGILFTAIMAVMGSNFWFDILNRLINVRNSGKKPPSTETAAQN